MRNTGVLAVLALGASLGIATAQGFSSTVEMWEASIRLQRQRAAAAAERVRCKEAICESRREQGLRALDDYIKAAKENACATELNFLDRRERKAGIEYEKAMGEEVVALNSQVDALRCVIAAQQNLITELRSERASR